MTPFVLASFVVALFLGQVGATKSKFVEVPRIADAGIDVRYLLRDEVLRDPGSLLVTAEDLVKSEFPAAKGDSSVARATTFGDLVMALREKPTAKDEVANVRSRLARERKDLPKATLAALSELLSASALVHADWTPKTDAKDDGIWITSSMRVGSRLGVPGSGDRAALVQGAVLVFADLKTIKGVERDYPDYEKRPHSAYVAIGMVKDSFRTGTAADLGRFSAHVVRFESDLPFPFTTYTCDLHVLDRIDSIGRLRCDVYSSSPDFYWLAGCDVYLPVRSSSGELIAWLIVREFGFDLDGVPDGDGDRAESLRAQLGNIKRDAERVYGDRALPKTDGPEIVFDADAKR